MHRIMAAALASMLTLTCGASAQVNIETHRGKKGFNGAARFAVNSDVGNVDVVRSDGAGHLTLNGKTGTLLVVMRGATGFLGGKRYANSGVLHLRYTHTGRELIHPEAFVQGDYARSRRLDSRSLAGLGGRWNLWRREDLSLALGSAIMWERERLDLLPTDPHPEITSEARLSNYVNLYVRNGRGVSLSTTAYYQPVLSAPEDARLLGTVKMTTPILGPLTQTTVVDFRIDTEPPQGVESTDIRLTASLGVVFDK